MVATVSKAKFLFTVNPRGNSWRAWMRRVGSVVGGRVGEVCGAGFLGAYLVRAVFNPVCAWGGRSAYRG